MSKAVQVYVPIESTPYWYQVDAPVILDKNLSAQSKVVYALISGLTRSTGECWASNQYMSDLIGVSKDTISRCISELKEHGHIESIVQNEYRRIITLSYSRDRQKYVGGYAKTPRGLCKNDEGDRQKSVENNNNELDKLIYIAKNHVLGMCMTIPAVLTWIRKTKLNDEQKKQLEIKVMACAKQEHTIYEIHELVETSLPKNCIENTKSIGPMTEEERIKREGA